MYDEQGNGGRHDDRDRDRDRSRSRQRDSHYVDYNQDNRSRKDQSRSPRPQQHRPDGIIDSYYGSGDPRDYRQSRAYHDRGSEGPSSRGRDQGEHRSYWDRDSSSYRRDRDRDRDALNYDDRDQSDYRGHYRDDYRRDRSPVRRHSPRRDYRGRDEFYDRRNDRGYVRSRSPSPYKSRAGIPSDTIVIDDIADDITETDLNFGMSAINPAGLQEIRLRKDRGSGRKIAFLEFDRTQSAADFLEMHHPDLMFELPLPHDGTERRAPVLRISFGRSKRDVERSGDWRCDACRSSNYSYREQCFRCSKPRRRPSSAGSDAPPILTGDSDACPQQKPYHILVFRDLESSVSEEILAKGITKLYMDSTQDAQPTGPSGLKTTAPVGNTRGLGARPGSLRRVFLIRDRKNRGSWGYGFAEFSNLEDAAKAIAKYQASPRYTIASKPVTVAYIHTGVFVPVFPPEPQIAPFVFSTTHNPDIKLRYWDNRAFASEFVVSEDPSIEAGTPEEAEGDKKDGKKKRKADKDVTGVPKKKPLVMAPQMQMWQNRSAELRGKQLENTPPDGTAPSSNEPDVATARKTLDIPVPGVPPVPPVQADPVYSYADTNRICCLLCQRKLKSIDVLRRHEAESSMHKENLKSDEKKATAVAALEKVGLAPALVEPAGPQYRDRAKERRQAHNQPKKPQHHHNHQHASNSNKPTPEEKKPEPQQPAAPKMSKGLAMLEKMGLKAGAGLGAEGAGRTEIIETELYRPGVGLGAEGGKIGDASEEAARQTRNNYGDFVEKAKDKARERFENMK